jgi:hypothetical protein
MDMCMASSFYLEILPFEPINSRPHICTHILQLIVYFKFYNGDRHYQGLGYKMPAQVYFGATEKLESAVRAEENLTLARA